MLLEQQDAELFYQLWIPLLNFVNQKYENCPQLGTFDRGHNFDISAAKKIVGYLWAHTEIIDEYLSETNLTEEQAQIITGWKRCRSENILWNGI